MNAYTLPKFGLALVIAGGAAAYVGSSMTQSHSDPEFPVDKKALAQANVLGEDRLIEIVDASRNNELRFSGHFKNHLLSVTGGFLSINRDSGRWYVRAKTPSGDVGCHFSDDARAKPMADLTAGSLIQIGGFIDDTWMGEIKLENCNFWPVT